MSKRNIYLLIDDMLESGNKIKKYTEGMDFDLFVNDEKTVDAVIRNFEIIGEAANKIDSKNIIILNGRELGVFEIVSFMIILELTTK